MMGRSLFRPNEIRAFRPAERSALLAVCLSEARTVVRWQTVFQRRRESVVAGRLSRIASWLMQEQLSSVDKVPDNQTEGEQGKCDVKEAPVADDIAIQLLALHSTLHLV